MMTPNNATRPYDEYLAQLEFRVARLRRQEILLRAARLRRYYASCLSKSNPLTTRYVIRPFGRGAAAIDAHILLQRRVMNTRLKGTYR